MSDSAAIAADAAKIKAGGGDAARQAAALLDLQTGPPARHRSPASSC